MIINWGKRTKQRGHKFRIKDAKSRKMEDTRFLDLKVRIGFPYLYCHQGDCEHIIKFFKIRFGERVFFLF